MIIKFDKTLISKFEIGNFSSLVGIVGLYFIFLDELVIPYPFKNSRLIYIGMSESRINSIGNRLKSHLSGRSKNTGIVGYNHKWKLSFTFTDYEFLKHIFANENIERIETYFLEGFTREFGVYPICNNRRGDVDQVFKTQNTPKIDWSIFGDKNE